MKHLDSLNERQKEAVLQKDGPILIFAGAGAGKTKTLTHRILHLIKEGVAPSEILAITFTNKAAKEMRERVDKLLREDKELNVPISFNEKPFISTFHSLGVHILRENSKILGIPRNFTIYDKNDAKKAVRQALESSGLDPKQFEPGKILNVISRQKGDMITAEKFAEQSSKDYFPKIVSMVWNKYEKTLNDEKVLDFDDLLLKTVQLLKKNEDVLKKYQGVWKYIHIDEYQDTNKVQYEMSRLLVGERKNICVVGDADQNIYSWRGANLRNILNFEKDYPNAKVVFLEENYRSTQTILSAANSVIAKNKMRVEKNLFTKNAEGEKIGLYAGYDEVDEAYFIASKAKELITNGSKPEEIATLYRANFQSRALEEAFLSLSVPYQVLGVRFFERKEIKDILSYLQASINPESLSSIKRVINVPARGIGKVTIAKIFAGQEEALPGTMKIKYSNFKRILLQIKETSEKEKPSETIKFIMRETGIEKMLKDGGEDEKEQLENIRELVTLAVKYDTYEPREGIEKLLTDAALATDQDDMKENMSAVRLMTVHASKGLEFDHVFISGLEEDLFPHKRIGEGKINEEEEEEERRLFYVAITRARKKVTLTYAGVRTIFGSRQVNLPSEFIQDIPEDHIETESSSNDWGDRGRGAFKSIYFD